MCTKKSAIISKNCTFFSAMKYCEANKKKEKRAKKFSKKLSVFIFFRIFASRKGVGEFV